MDNGYYFNFKKIFKKTGHNALVLLPILRPFLFIRELIFKWSSCISHERPTPLHSDAIWSYLFQSALFVCFVCIWEGFEQPFWGFSLSSWAYILVMSPSRAGSSHSSSWTIFSSARLVTFFVQLEEKFQLENWKIGIFSLVQFHSIFGFLRWMIPFHLRITNFCPRKKMVLS